MIFTHSLAARGMTTSPFSLTGVDNTDLTILVHEMAPHLAEEVIFDDQDLTVSDVLVGER